MSTDLLREAVERLRDPYRCNTPAYESALADWLDVIATVTELGHPVAFVDHAITVARQIVGRAA